MAKYEEQFVWESEGQFKARTLFIKKAKKLGIDEDRIAVLSSIYYNVKYLGCKYREDDHSDLERIDTIFIDVGDDEE